MPFYFVEKVIKKKKRFNACKFRKRPSLIYEWIFTNQKTSTAQKPNRYWSLLCRQRSWLVYNHNLSRNAFGRKRCPYNDYEQGVQIKSKSAQTNGLRYAIRNQIFGWQRHAPSRYAVFSLFFYTKYKFTIPMSWYHILSHKILSGKTILSY